EADHGSVALEHQPRLGPDGGRALADAFIQPEPVGKARDDRVARGCVGEFERPDPAQRRVSLHEAGTSCPRSMRSTENRSSFTSTAVAISKLTHSSPGDAWASRSGSSASVAPTSSARWQ